MTSAPVQPQLGDPTAPVPADVDGVQAAVPLAHPRSVAGRTAPRARPGGPLAGRTVAVVGLGYVGLPTALALRDAGADVVGIDVSTERLRDVRAGRVDLLPEQLGRLEAEMADPQDASFRLTAEPAAVTAADAVLICVPTPVDRHQVPDLRMLSAACAGVVRHAVPGQLLLLTSTSYVGTTRELVIDPLRARGLDAGTDVFVAFAPERIDPGNSAHGQERTPRVVGGASPACTERAADLLAGIAQAVHRVDSPEAAEMTKLWENTFRAVNIALANELADSCHSLGLDPRPVIAAAATKPFGFMPFYPGPGVGGHCIPCDPHYLLWQLRARREHVPLIDTAMRAIGRRPQEVVRRACQRLATAGVPTAGARILLVGLAYKEGVADLRESPALEIAGRLADAGAQVEYLDPLVPSARLAGAVRSAVTDPGATDWDLVVIHTVHPGTDLSWLDADRTLDVGHRLDAVAAAR
ncbi:nucleotide sugar dehydrogenase [Streptomyces longwoodensis]